VIGIESTFDDQSPQFLALMQEGQNMGLHASANGYRNDMKKALRMGGKGYVFKTSTGNVGKIVNGKRRPWSVGYLWNTITLSPIERWLDGWAIRVGTNVLYALFWELGHHNIFTKRFERDPKWVPTFLANQSKYAAAFSAAFRRTMSKFQGPKPKTS
jgi:hypothetical protein